MNKLYAFLLCLVLSFSAVAQTPFSKCISDGDVKVTERMYDQARMYYNEALKLAANSNEVQTAKGRLRKLDVPKPKITKAKSTKNSNSFLFREKYVQTGDKYNLYTGEVSHDAGSDSHHYIYVLAVREKSLTVKSDAYTETGDIDKAEWLEFPLVKETKQYRLYSADDMDDSFLIFKEEEKGENGSYHQVIHREGDVDYYLYTDDELKNFGSALSEDIPEDKTVEPKATTEVEVEVQQEVTPVVQETEAEVQQEVTPVAQEVQPDVAVVPTTTAAGNEFPVSFVDSWFVNNDADMKQIGDSRIERLYAEEVCWLTLIAEYNTVWNPKAPVHMDVKIFGPDESLLDPFDDAVRDGYTDYINMTVQEGKGMLNYMFGSDDPGALESGIYKVELWYNDKLCYTARISLE